MKSRYIIQTGLVCVMSVVAAGCQPSVAGYNTDYQDGLYSTEESMTPRADEFLEEVNEIIQGTKETCEEIYSNIETDVGTEEDYSGTDLGEQICIAEDFSIISPYDEGFDENVVPDYMGEAYVTINGDIPYFKEYTTQAFEYYSNLDDLGRCGYTYANICSEIMPTEERGEIGSVKPTGWHTQKYDFIDGLYLYNRCHLIGYQLSGENANKQNLVTGTRSMNIKGMLPFENIVADYVHETGNHVMYRVTPIFENNDMLCQGVLLEAYSVEDSGSGVEFCVFAYNVEPGVTIDYATGDSWLEENDNNNNLIVEKQYILNTNTKKYHIPGCDAINDIAENNRVEYTGTSDLLEAEGYTACKRCAE